MNQSEKISFSVERRRRIALNVVGSIVGLLAILIFLNILSRNEAFYPFAFRFTGFFGTFTNDDGSSQKVRERCQGDPSL